jgi:hypothetical protein
LRATVAMVATAEGTGARKDADADDRRVHVVKN